MKKKNVAFEYFKLKSSKPDKNKIKNIQQTNVCKLCNYQ